MSKREKSLKRIISELNGLLEMPFDELANRLGISKISAEEVNIAIEEWLNTIEEEEEGEL